MEYDSADILGHKDSLVPPVATAHGFAFSLTQSAGILALLVLAYSVGMRVWQSVLQWREKSHKLATRRRHGIPDSDLRPFNVAYADAMARAREDESRRSSYRPSSFRPQPPALDQREAPSESTLRQRPQTQLAPARSSVAPVPGAFTSMASDFARGRHSEASTSTGRTLQPTVSQVIHQTYLQRHREEAADLRKRMLDVEVEDDEPELKKSRVGHQDGDEEAYQDYPNGHARRRVPKRSLQEEEDEDEDEESEDTSAKPSRGKRARKVSLEKKRSWVEEMEVDEDEEVDDVPEMDSLARGKKRDRTEAGSTFGGDDSEHDHHGVEENVDPRRRRKRRTVAKRLSEGSYVLGKKRERDVKDDIGDEDSDASSPSIKKRGKRRGHYDETRSDVSMNGSTSSLRGKHRNIGDEWESNGVRWKIGPNGQRLRQALVKKARQKFIMPKDSQHPDRDANLQVCIETWLTEEEYRDAKHNHMLAWQDPPKKAEAGELSIDTNGVAFPTSGKNLLWSASGSTASTPTGSPASHSTYDGFAARPRNYARHSLTSGTLSPMNPFVDSKAPTVKRIASTSRAISLNSSTKDTGLSDSTNASPRGPKLFSKWEKQEMEAQAMMKLREANRKKEEERAAKAKEEKNKLEAATKPAIPLITLTAPSTDSVVAPSKPAGNLFSLTVPAAAPAGATPKAEPTATTTSTTPATTTSSVPNFFANPSQPLGPTPGAASSAAPKTPGFNLGGPAPTTNGTASTSFSFNPAPAAEKKDSKPAAAVPSFSFAPAAPAAAKKEEKPLATPSFSFGPVSTPAPSEVKPSTAPSMFGAPAPTSSGNSLLSRVAPAPAANPGEPPKPAAPAPASAPFSFAVTPKPAAGPATTGTATAAFPAPTTGTAGSTTKFDFGFGKPAANGTSTTMSNPFGAAPVSSSSLNGALGPTSEQKTANGTTSAFGFKAPTAPTPASTESVPKFSFTGVPSAAPTTNGTNGTKPTFSFGPSTAPTNPPGNPFAPSTTVSNPAATTTTSKFGFGQPPAAASSTTSAFGTAPRSNAAPSNPFGASTTTPSKNEPPKFSFSTPTNNPSSGMAVSTTPATNPTFSFTAGGASTTPTTTPSTSKFGFGSGMTSTTPMGPPPSSSGFTFNMNGAGPKPAAAPAPAPSSGSMFGGAKTNGSGPSAPSSGNAFTFNFGGASSGAGGSGAAPSAFGTSGGFGGGGAFGKTPMNGAVGSTGAAPPPLFGGSSGMFGAK